MELTNKYGLHPALYQACRMRPYGKEETFRLERGRIGAYTLTQAPRRMILQARHWEEIEEDATDRAWRIMGTATHKLMEMGQVPNTITEVRMELERRIDSFPWTVGMRADLIEVNENGLALHDYKSGSVWTLKFFDPTEHEPQINLYILGLNQSFGLVIRSAYVTLIMRDWMQSKAGQNGYPDSPFEVIPIGLWALASTDSYLRQRLALFDKCLDFADDELPHCTPAETWARDEAWAIMYNGRKTALKVFNDEIEAKEALRKQTVYIPRGTKLISYPASKCRLEHRPLRHVRCEDYCIVRPFCSQMK